jgi:hypothetical protein
VTPRIRQLLCLWLLTAIALLPVSGSLLAAMTAPADAAAPGFAHHQHHGQQSGMDHLAHHHDPDAPVPETGTPDDTPDTGLAPAHDCTNGLCLGGCAGCTGCAAPPADGFRHHHGMGLLSLSQHSFSATPPAGALFRPPISATV